MTVSMLTTRLSEVMTGCGGKETTCSRRSTLARILSTNGTRKWMPPSRVREYRPSRSMIRAVCCGTMRTVRMMTIAAKTTSSARTMYPAEMSMLRSVPSLREHVAGNDRRGSLNGHDTDLLARRARCPALGAPGRPGLAGEFDPAVGGGDRLEHPGRPAHQAAGPDGVTRAGVELPFHPRAHRNQQGDGHDHEDDDLQREPRTERCRHSGGERTGREHDEHEVDGGGLDGRQDQSHAEPGQPRVVSQPVHQSPPLGAVTLRTLGPQRTFPRRCAPEQTIGRHGARAPAGARRSGRGSPPSG